MFDIFYSGKIQVASKDDMQMEVISTGDKDCGFRNLDLYINVLYFISWIKSNFHSIIMILKFEMVLFLFYKQASLFNSYIINCENFL